jgi:hypothetical protein
MLVSPFWVQKICTVHRALTRHVQKCLGDAEPAPLWGFPTFI